MTARRYAVAGVVVSGAAFLVCTTRPWVSGRTADPVLGGATVTATGAQAAPAAVALAAVCLAAVVVVLTAGPRVRVAATVVLVVSAVGAGLVVARVVADPAGVLSVRAAEQAGRTGTVAVTATLTGWAWLAVGCGVVLVACSVWLAVALRGAGGLSGRFDRPSVSTDRGSERARSSWDALSEGRDPTDSASDGR